MLATRGEADAELLLQRSRAPVILLDQSLGIIAAESYALDLLGKAFPDWLPSRAEIPLAVAHLLYESLPSAQNLTTVIADLILHVSCLQGEQTLYVLSVERRAFRDHLHRASTKFGLSKREEEVLALITSGGRAADIAEALHISVTTVNGHFKNLMRKTGVRNRFELVAKVFES
jgi:DNA-binding CsgD family transcriptional regulator